MHVSKVIQSEYLFSCDRYDMFRSVIWCLCR